MIELEADVYSSALPVLRDFPHKRAFLWAVLEHVQEGRVFVDALDSPSVGIVAHVGGHVLLAGDAANEDAWTRLSEFVSERVSENGRVILVPQDRHWQDGIVTRFKDRAQPDYRITYLHHGATKPIPPPIQGSEPIVLVDMEKEDPIDPQIVRVLTRSWGSLSRFRKYGVGFNMRLESGQVASICYSVSVGDRMAPIQVSTEEVYRRRGFAYAVGTHYINRCRDRGIAPFWERAEDNVASAELACKLGFREHDRLTRYWISAD